jgi:hypothetical protein
VDNAGNEEDYRHYSFCVLEDPSSPAGMMRERIRILAALEEIMAFQMRKDFEANLPIDPSYVAFEFAKVSQKPVWHTMGIDRNEYDGWGIRFDTHKMENGDYFIRMSAIYDPPPPKGPANAGITYPLLIHQETITTTISNISDTAYEFKLTAPADVDRGDVIPYTIEFINQSSGSMDDIHLSCNLDPGLYKHIEVLDNGRLDKNGLPAWYLKNLQSGGTWKVRFTAQTRGDLTPGSSLTSQAVLSAINIPQLISDNPATKDYPDDYTEVTINLVSGAISGHIKDALFNTPVNAMVMARASTGTIKRTLTDDNGYYRFSDLVPGDYLILAGASGYVYDSPGGPADILINGSGSAVTADFYLSLKDDIAPVTTLLTPLADIIQGSAASIKGTAVDYHPGTGVEKVMVQIYCHSDHTYWNGNGWDLKEHWLPASGASQWSMNLNSIRFSSQRSYTIQARATDYSGNEGMPAMTTTVSDFRTPSAVSPPEDAAFYGQVEFVWSFIEDAVYRLQVDNDADFSSPEFNLTDLHSNSATLAGFSSGTHYWRTKAADLHTGHPQSDWSEGGKFHILDPPCRGDFNSDGDVDGGDLYTYIAKSVNIPLSDFAKYFGRSNCSGTMN